MNSQHVPIHGPRVPSDDDVAGDLDRLLDRVEDSGAAPSLMMHIVSACADDPREVLRGLDALDAALASRWNLLPAPRAYDIPVHYGLTKKVLQAEARYFREQLKESPRTRPWGNSERPAALRNTPAAWLRRRADDVLRGALGERLPEMAEYADWLEREAHHATKCVSAREEAKLDTAWLAQCREVLESRKAPEINNLLKFLQYILTGPGKIVLDDGGKPPRSNMLRNRVSRARNAGR